MRKFYMILLVLLPFAAIAEEAVVETPVSVPAEPWWAQALVAVLVPAILYGLKLLRERTKTDSELAKLDSTKSLIEQKEILLRRIMDTAARVAETWAEENLAVILKDATDGGGFDWKWHFKNAYTSVRSEVITVFKHEGIDILTVVGEERLSGMLNKAISKAITWLPEKFRGLVPEEMTSKLSDKIAEFALARASDWVEKKVEA